MIILSSCELTRPPSPLSLPYESIDLPINVPPPTPDQAILFNRSVKAHFDSLKKANGITVRGYVSRNREFFEKILKPVLASRVYDLANQHPVWVINAITLFSHRAYQAYFGKGFYRWGGDILDLDDPQEAGARCEYAFGLDCSGFASMPYDVAVQLGVLDPASIGALFSSDGFALYCRQHPMQDLGGRDSTSNRHRVDTYDFLRMGREIFALDRGTFPMDDQMGLLQPGDIVCTSGHVGIIVDINGEPYYVESGGWVLPRSGNNPYHAREALAIFAHEAPLTIRRALPDYRVQVATAVRP